MSTPHTDFDAASDAELLEGWALHQDPNCLGSLIHRYNALVLGVCLRQCRSRADVEDAFQATFLQLSRSAAKIKNPASLPAWLHSVAYRVAVRTRRMYENSHSEAIEIPVEDQPFQQIASRHDLQLLDEELNKLPAHCRQAVVLFHLEGLSIGEIAQQTNSTIGAVRGLLQRSRTRLRSRLLRRGINLSAALTAINLLPFHAINAAEVTTKTRLLCQAAANTTSSSPDSPETSIPPQTKHHIQHLETLLQPSGISSMSTLSFGIGSATASIMFLLAILPWQQPEGPAPTIALVAKQTVENDPFAAPGGQPTGNAKEKQETAGSVRIPGDLMQYEPGESSGNIEPKIKLVLAQPTVLSFDDLPLADLIETLKTSTKLPIFLDSQSLSEANISPSIKLQSNVPGSSLEGILYAALNPVGLQAVVENDMLVIKVDHDAHALAGGKTTRWITENDQKVNATIEKLNQLYSGNYNQIPLEDFVRAFSTEMDIPLIIATRSLEDIGLTRDLPMTTTGKDMKALEFLNLMLAENDLALNFKNGVLQITTEESASAPDNQMLRMYWLDGIGMADPSKVIELIATTISPGSWEALGGPSTIVNFDQSDRNAILVSSTFSTHLHVESLLNSLRDITPQPATSAPQKIEPKPETATAPLASPPGAGGGTTVPDPFGSPSTSDDPFGG